MELKIVILRHGEVDMPPVPKLKARELRAWIEEYNSARVGQKLLPSEQLLRTAAGCGAVVCSDLPRSIQSAEILNVRQIHCSDSVFREVDLPHARWNSVKLRPYTWAVLFRTLWFFGYSSNGESFRAAMLRAKTGAQKLIHMAAEHGSVLFVGHGFLNHYIAKELVSRDWQGPRRPGRGHWEFGVYKYNRSRP